MSEERKDIDSKHPLLKDLDLSDILVAAERWQALTSREVQFPMLAPQGFTDAEQAKNPNQRTLSLTMNLGPSSDAVDMRESTVAAHKDAVYKLTEVADLVRARVLEERSA